MHVPGALCAFLMELVPAWRAIRLTNLALLAAAILARRSLSFSELARAYPDQAASKIA